MNSSQHPKIRNEGKEEVLKNPKEETMVSSPSTSQTPTTKNKSLMSSFMGLVKKPFHRRNHKYSRRHKKKEKDQELKDSLLENPNQNNSNSKPSVTQVQASTASPSHTQAFASESTPSSSHTQASAQVLTPSPPNTQTSPNPIQTSGQASTSLLNQIQTSGQAPTLSQNKTQISFQGQIKDERTSSLSKSQSQGQKFSSIEHSKSHIIVSDNSALSLQHNFSKASKIKSNGDPVVVDLSPELESKTLTGSRIKPKRSTELKKQKFYRKNSVKKSKKGFIYRKLHVKRLFAKKKKSSAVLSTKSSYSQLSSKNSSLKVLVNDNSSSKIELPSLTSNPPLLTKPTEGKDFSSLPDSDLKNFYGKDKYNLESTSLEVSIPYAVVGSFNTTDPTVPTDPTDPTDPTNSAGFIETNEPAKAHDSSTNPNVTQASGVSVNQNMVFSFGNISDLPLISGMEPMDSLPPLTSDEPSTPVSPIKGGGNSLKFDSMVNEPGIDEEEEEEEGEEGIHKNSSKPPEERLETQGSPGKEEKGEEEEGKPQSNIDPVKSNHEIKFNYNESLKINQPSFIIKTSTPQILQEVTPQNLSESSVLCSKYNESRPPYAHPNLSEIKENNEKEDHLETVVPSVPDHPSTVPPPTSSSAAPTTVTTAPDLATNTTTTTTTTSNALPAQALEISSTTEDFPEDEIKIYCGLPDRSLDTCQAVVEKVAQYFADNVACFWSIFPLNENHQRMGNWKLGEYLDRWFRSSYENCILEISKMISTPDQFLIERLLKFQLKSCSWTAYNNYLQYTLIRLCMEKEDDQHIHLLLRYFIVPPHLWSRVSYFMAELLDFASGIYPDYDVIVSELTDSYDLVHRMNPVQLCLTAIYMGTTIVPKRKRPSIFKNTINDELYDHEYNLLELMVCLVIENCMKRYCESEIIKYLMSRYAPLVLSFTESNINILNSMGELSSFAPPYNVTTATTTDTQPSEDPPTNTTSTPPTHTPNNTNSLQFNLNLMKQYLYQQQNSNTNSVDSKTKNQKQPPNTSNATSQSQQSRPNHDNKDQSNASTHAVNLSALNNTSQTSNNLYFSNSYFNSTPLNQTLSTNESSNGQPIGIPMYLLHDQSSFDISNHCIDINDPASESEEVLPNSSNNHILPSDHELEPDRVSYPSPLPELVDDPVEDSSSSFSSSAKPITPTSLEEKKPEPKSGLEPESKPSEPTGSAPNRNHPLHLPSSSAQHPQELVQPPTSLPYLPNPSSTLDLFPPSSSDYVSFNSKIAMEGEGGPVFHDQAAAPTQPLELKKKVKGGPEEEQKPPKMNPLSPTPLEGKRKTKAEPKEELSSRDESFSYSERHSFRISDQLSLSSGYNQLRRSTQSISTMNSTSLPLSHQHPASSLQLYEDMEENEEDESDFDRNTNYTALGIKHYTGEGKEGGEKYSVFDLSNPCPSFYSYNLRMGGNKGKKPMSLTLSLSSSSSSFETSGSYDVDGKAEEEVHAQDYSFISVLSSKPSLSMKSVRDDTTHNSKVVLHEFASTSQAIPSRAQGGLVGSISSVKEDYPPSTSAYHRISASLPSRRQSQSQEPSLSPSQEPSHLIVHPSFSQLYPNDKFTLDSIPSTSYGVLDQNHLDLNTSLQGSSKPTASFIHAPPSLSTSSRPPLESKANEAHSMDPLVEHSSSNPSPLAQKNLDDTNPSSGEVRPTDSHLDSHLFSQSTILNILRHSNYDMNMKNRNDALLDTIHKVNPHLNDKVVEALELVDYYQHGTSIQEFYENYTIEHLNELESLLRLFNLFDIQQIQNDIMDWVDRLVMKY